MNKTWKKRWSKKGISLIALLLAFLLLLSGCGGQAESNAKAENQAANQNVEVQQDGAQQGEVAKEAENVTSAEVVTEEITPLVHASFLGTQEEEPLPEEAVVPSVEGYTIESDLSNVEDADRYKYLLQNDDFRSALAENGFVVMDYHNNEFFGVYESNRYGQYPNFVTVDSLMHTYHLAFALLLRRTEKEYLYDELGALSMSMFQEALTNYETLKGSEWEEAAALNVMFFAVGTMLLDMDPAVPEELADAIEADYDLIMDANLATDSQVLKLPLDFSQFKPRGYYEGDAVMEAYFRAMMWYGLAGMPVKNEEETTETLTKAALLITLELDGSRLESWEKIYTVTSFFAGASDDLSYYEMRPLIDHVYGEGVYVSDLIGDSEKWDRFYDMTTTLRAPAINSMVTVNDEQDEVQREFRFMGQRYTVDAEMFQKLMYEDVKENASGEKRMLPDALDIPAAMGSDAAVRILEEQGDTSFEGYPENMAALREKFGDESDPVWSASLYASWLNTLHPVLREKGEGYPSFMQNEEWNKKALETFSASFAELKHDTVLYTKQAVAEMGGGDMEVFDDRGYVEPEPEVYARFTNLARKTSEGLRGYGVLSSENEESLAILEELGRMFFEISNKELAGEVLTDDEYELIRSYGGTIEHFWRDLAIEITGDEYVQTTEFPADTIVDVATDLEAGRVLEIAVGGASKIYVVVPVDGKLKIASGAVYNFYQFEQPLSDRLTDSEWRQLVHETDQPEWTQSYRIKMQY